MAAVWEPGSLDHFYGMATLKVPEDLKAWFSSLFRAFPDFEMVVADMVAYGNKAAVRWTATGTFTGEGKFEGLTATGASVELEGLDLLTIEDGKIVENRAYTNATEMAPPAGRDASRWIGWREGDAGHGQRSHRRRDPDQAGARATLAALLDPQLGLHAEHAVLAVERRAPHHVARALLQPQVDLLGRRRRRDLGDRVDALRATPR